MAITRSKEWNISEVSDKPLIEDAFSLVIRGEQGNPLYRGAPSIPALVNSKWLIDALTLRSRNLSRDVRNALQDGGLNEEGFAVNTDQWLEAIEDMQEAIAWLISSNPPRHREISFNIVYANAGVFGWTISRVSTHRVSTHRVSNH